MKKKADNSYMIIYARRQQLDFCIPSAKQVFSLPFSPEILADLTILKPEEYKKSVSKCLAQHKVEKHTILVVLSKEVCFVRPLTTPQKSEDPTQPVTTDEQLKKIRESMPFGNVYVRLIKFPKEQQIVAVNRDFFEPLLELLAEQEQVVTTMVPEIAVALDLTQTGLTLENGALLAKEVAKLEVFDLLETEDKPRQFITTSATPAEKKRTWLLVVIFVCLLGALGLVYWYVSDADAKERARKGTPVAPLVEPMVAPVIAPILTPEIASAPAMLATVSATPADVTAIEASSPEEASGAGLVRGMSTSSPQRKIATGSARLLRSDTPITPEN